MVEVVDSHSQAVEEQENTKQGEDKDDRVGKEMAVLAEDVAEDVEGEEMVVEEPSVEEEVVVEGSSTRKQKDCKPKERYDSWLAIPSSKSRGFSRDFADLLLV